MREVLRASEVAVGEMDVIGVAGADVTDVDAAEVEEKSLDCLFSDLLVAVVPSEAEGGEELRANGMLQLPTLKRFPATRTLTMLFMYSLYGVQYFCSNEWGEQVGARWAYEWRPEVARR